MTSGMYNNREYREQKSTFSKLYRTRYIYGIVYDIQLYQIQPSTIYSYLPYIALPDIALPYITLLYIALLNIDLPDITVDQAINKYQALQPNRVAPQPKTLVILCVGEANYLSQKTERAGQPIQTSRVNIHTKDLFNTSSLPMAQIAEEIGS